MRALTGSRVTMMTRARQVTAAALAAAALAALVLLSEVTWRSSDPDAAELRLSWRIPAPSYRQCRPPTEAELSGVLPHMRPSEVCTDTAIPFRLTIRLNGDTLRSEPVTRSGSRARTITVYRSFAASPGSYVLDVVLLPELPPDPAPDFEDFLQELAMTLNARVSAGPGDVILVSSDEDGRLTAVGSATGRQ
ncbi:MAG: hypothetical protein F4139_14115 [Gemmatimonadetes bacterium]|nr:hypothetical protein [Gemmatimonadota bacterium]MYK67821.1 hypothetical protein [Gemmatimonadota bacterium]